MVEIGKINLKVNSFSIKGNIRLINLVKSQLKIRNLLFWKMNKTLLNIKIVEVKNMLDNKFLRKKNMSRLL